MFEEVSIINGGFMYVVRVHECCLGIHDVVK